MSDAEDRESSLAVILDYLPHGRPDDDRPQYKKPALVHAVRQEDFQLVECELADEADVTIGDELDLSSATIESVRDTSFDQLTSGAHSELKYAIRSIIDADQRRFVDYYNEAQPITLRLHQLNLLPGIGKKLRNNILEERKCQPFDSFEDLEERVSGLHNSKEILVERIHEELREEDLKYRSFAN